MALFVAASGYSSNLRLEISYSTYSIIPQVNIRHTILPASLVPPLLGGCSASNPKKLSRRSSRHGYMAHQSGSVATSSPIAHRIQTQKGNTRSERVCCAKRARSPKSKKPMDRLAWIAPPDHRRRVPLS